METISSSSGLLASEKSSHCQGQDNSCKKNEKELLTNDRARSNSQGQTQDHSCKKNEKGLFTKRPCTMRRDSDLTTLTALTASTANTNSTCGSSLPCTELLITAITQEMIKSMMYAATSGHNMTQEDLQNLLLEKLGACASVGSQTSPSGDVSTSGGPSTGKSQCSTKNTFADDEDSKAPSQSDKTRSTSGSSTAKNNAALQDYLANLKEVTSDSDSSEDNSSVVSDISGLTGVFSEHNIKMLAKEVVAGTHKEARSARVIEANERHTKQQQTSAALTASTAPVVAARRRPGTSSKTSFGSVDVRYYERIASDNPASSSGPSIGIGWNFEQRELLTVDAWEKERSSLRRGCKECYQLNAKQRTNILLKAGCTNKEIVDMIRIINKTRSQRKSTIDNLSVQKVEEVVEQTKRSLGRLLFGSRKQMIEC
jgi:hypothetical protein